MGTARSVTHVVGARPNFMKAAPVIRALGQLTGVRQRLVHTGQHYDAAMSDLFFRQLGLPPADVNLGVGSASHAQQTASIMTGLDSEFASNRPDMLVVYGDVNSTLAAAVVAAKLGVRVAHVEAGVRSFDRSMPEEINRLITDRVANLLLTPTADADANLLREGTDPSWIHRVGNTMIDSVVWSLPNVERAHARDLVGLPGDEPFVLATLHRASTVDDPRTLEGLLQALAELARDIAVVFPVHPRTRGRIKPGWAGAGLLKLTAPLGYMEFLALQSQARVVITDSGGVQAETTFLGIPCVTVRDNTEWPITATEGTNQLVGRDPARMLMAARAMLATAVGEHRQAAPHLWDGRAGERTAAVIGQALS